MEQSTSDTKMNEEPHMENLDLTIFDHAQSLANKEQLEKAYVCRIQDQGLLKVTGEDAASFLHNQLSNDVERLKMGEARYAAYCSPKGRMLASFYYWKHEDAIFLQCAANLLPALQKRLQMFVMRAKVKIEDVSANFVSIAFGGKTQIPQLFTVSNPTAVHACATEQGSFLIRREDSLEAMHFMAILDRTHAESAIAKLFEDCQVLDACAWRLAQIYAGVAQVQEQIKEQFVPQMLNFELIGGVNFRKGCYPGQEIVARSQYLGKLKRRMSIARIVGANLDQVLPGAEIFSEDDPEQPCGMIVTAERDFDGVVVCLAEIKLSAHEAGKVHLGSVDGALLAFQALPYAYIDVTE